MKKIIATVLAMVMALALCTTAFAAEVTEKANVDTAAGGLDPGLGQGAIHLVRFASFLFLTVVP